MVRKGYDYNWLKMVIHGYIYIYIGYFNWIIHEP